MDLLSTDFDGTLVGFPERLSCPTPLAEALLATREAGTAWVVNTGRSLYHLDEGLAEFSAPFAPDFAIVNERHIFRRRSGDWVACPDWNARCDADHLHLGKLTEKALRRTLQTAARELDFQIIEEGIHPTGIITRDEPTMEELVLRFEKVVAEHPDFDYQRNTIYLRFSHRDYTKGTALRELARELGVERERILAVGDNHNDLSMLDGAHAAMVACPANAVPEVRQAVEAAAGWVSEHPDALGTAEGIVYFLARSPSRS